LDALESACHPEIAAATKGYRTVVDRFQVLTVFLGKDTVPVGKELEVKTEVSIEYCVV